MNKITEPRYCLNCEKQIPVSRNKGAIYCNNECGYEHRNNKNALEKKRLKELEPGLHKSYNVVKSIARMKVFDVSIQTAIELGMDFDSNQGLINVDNLKNTTEYRLFEFTYTIYDDRIRIKKINDERP